MRWLGVAVLAACASCANVTTTRIYRASDGQIHISSGKDVKIEYLRYSYSPTGGEVTVEVQGYSSNASADAINAQAQREQQVISGVLKAVEIGARGAVVP